MISGFAWAPVLALVPIWLLLARRTQARAQAARARTLAALGDVAVLGAFGRIDDGGAARRRHWLRAAAIVLALVALARPQGSTKSTTGQGIGRDLLFAIDLSRSMTVQDVGQNRLVQAKQTAKELVGDFDIGDRAGLIIFGGAAFLQLPMTSDRDAFDRFLDAVSVELLDDPSTDLTAPLETAATVFEHEGGDGHRALVLLSDGDDEVEHRERAIAKLQKARVPVFAVGIGTPSGGLVPKAPGDTTGGASNPWHADGIGRPVESKLESGPLKEIASGTRGLYTAFDDGAGRSRLREAIRAISARPLGAQRRTERTELFQWPLALALVLLALEQLVRPPARQIGPAAAPSEVRASSRPRVPRQAAVLTLVPLWLLITSCSGGRIVLDRGTRLYEAGRHGDALDVWKAELDRKPTTELHYNVGSALFRMGRYEVAVKEFAEAAAPAGPLRTSALFNLGTAALRAAENSEKTDDLLDRAIASFEDVLIATPGDSLTRWNLEIALKRRGDRDTGGSPGTGGRANAGRGQGREEGLNDSRETAVAAMAGGGSGSTEGESAKEIDEQEARKQLDALERELLSSHEGRQAKHGQRGERDW